MERFLVDRAGAADAGHLPRALEELLVVEEEDGLSLGLFLDETLVAGAARGGLGQVAVLAEGVSHFVYLATHAARGCPVSLLELEVQAEVDKFALLLLRGRAWRRSGRRRSRALRRLLYERIGFRADLEADELLRYRLANRLGAGYARWLEGRFVDGADDAGLLRELRQSYRLGAGEKLGHLASRAVH